MTSLLRLLGKWSRIDLDVVSVQAYVIFDQRTSYVEICSPCKYFRPFFCDADGQRREGGQNLSGELHDYDNHNPSLFSSTNGFPRWVTASLICDQDI